MAQKCDKGISIPHFFANFLKCRLKGSWIYINNSCFIKLVTICKNLDDGGIFHRDIKDENILINTETLDVKLIDFGCSISCHSADIFKIACGTPEFFAPEFYSCNKYSSESATCWSLGCLLFILIVGHIPFDNKNDIIEGKLRKVHKFLLILNFW